jgi:hypothetical protein
VRPTFLLLEITLGFLRHPNLRDNFLGRVIAAYGWGVGNRMMGYASLHPSYELRAGFIITALKYLTPHSEARAHFLASK